jgi:ParB-like chromosome segregation protein Spo0J
VKRASLLRDREWLKSLELPIADINKAREQIGKITAFLPTDPESINTPVGQLVKGLTKAIEKLDASTEKAWAEVVKRKKPSADETFLKQFETFDSTTETVTHIRILTKDPSDAKAPLDRDSLTAIENRWERLGELIAKLPKSTDNPDVQRFLNAVRKGGAPLSLLTDGVTQYLTEAGLFESFRIYQAK